MRVARKARREPLWINLAAAFSNLHFAYYELRIVALP